MNPSIGNARCAAEDLAADNPLRDLIFWLCDRIETLEHEAYLHRTNQQPATNNHVRLLSPDAHE